MSADAAGSGAPAPGEVRERLARVRDPELDRSIVELQYVEAIEVDGPRVRIRLRLPTAWCSPAFAWMMAADAEEAVGGLPGVEAVDVRLSDHMHAEEINRGLEEDLAFEEAFDDADDGLAAVRRKLDRKARMARQYGAVSALLDAGVDGEQIARLRREDVEIEGETGSADAGEGTGQTPAGDDLAAVYLDGGAFAVVVEAEPIVRYVEKARETGVVTAPDDRLFATREGDPVPAGEFDRVRRDSRLAKGNLEGQAAICGGLHEARHDDVDLGEE